MSLELSGTEPLVIAKTGILSNSVNLYGHDFDTDIPMDDFCALVEYALTNTDLYPDDPRVALLERLKKLTVIEGYNPKGKRLGNKC